MARAEKENLKDYKQLIKQISGFKETDDNFGVCLQFVTSNIRYHRFLDVDSHKVTRTLEGILDKLRIHSEEKKYSSLKRLSDTFLEKPIFEQKEHGKTDTHYSVLQFLMLIANNPVNNDYVETKKTNIPEIQVEFNWAEYLLEGIERYVPSDTELSDWSEDEEDSIDEKESVVKEVSIRDHSVTQQDDQLVQPYFVSDGSSVQWEEPSLLESADWLSRNLVPQYWRGEKLNVDTGNYLVCHLNNDWEAYKRSIDPLYGTARQTIVTENILMREIIWMLMGISKLHFLEYNGRYFFLKPHVAVPHLSEEILQECVSEFTQYGSNIQILQRFIGDSFNGCGGSGKDPFSQTLESFSTTIADFIQTVKKELTMVEQILIKQEEILTLIGLSKKLKPLFKKIQTVFMVYMKGVYEGRKLPTQTQRVTLLLTTLYNTLMWCDTLFETPAVGDGIEGVDGSSESAVMLNLLLPMWLQTCQPYINIIDTWISHGYLTDPRQEFIIQRNKDISTLDETFWEKSFAFHAMPETAVDDNRESKTDRTTKQEYQSTDWAPKFLQPVLQQIVLTGKSMEMLEVLGKLAEHEGKTTLNTREFREGHLYDKFITSMQTLLGVKLDTGQKDSDQTSPDKDQTPPDKDQTPGSVFTADIDRQMKEKDVFDSFLKIHFEKLMMTSDVQDSIMEESFVQTMKSLNLENLQPIELILQDCLYPHVHKQYEKVCGKLVHILNTEYQLLNYLGAMRNFFLMEAGDVMFIFYTEIFDKIRLHEHWKDTTSLTWALHDALDRQFPDEVSRLSVHVESMEGHDNQPINVTDCLRLQYQIPNPVDVVINERCQSIYNQIFRFLLQVKRAKYCLDELRFYDLQKSSSQSESDRLLSGFSTDNVPRAAKIHRMHLLRTRLINFVNCLHNYMMTRILHSVGLEFARDLKTAQDLDQIIEIHAGYIQKIHQRCLLHRKTTFLKEAVLKVLNLALRFQAEWDRGIDCINMGQIEDTEMEFSRCIQFLSSFLNTVIQRGSFPHLEALALGLVNLNPKIET